MLQSRCVGMVPHMAEYAPAMHACQGVSSEEEDGHAKTMEGTNVSPFA